MKLLYKVAYEIFWCKIFAGCFLYHFVILIAVAGFEDIFAKIVCDTFLADVTYAFVGIHRRYFLCHIMVDLACEHFPEQIVMIVTRGYCEMYL